MFDKIKKVGQDTIIYGLGSAISKLLGFILIPVYVKHIPISGFGYLTIYEITIQLLSVLFTFGISNAHQRFFYSEKKTGTYGIFLFNNYFGNLMLIIIFLSPFIYFSESLSLSFLNDISQNKNFKLALWIIPADILFNFVLQVFQYERKPFLFLLSSVVKLIITYFLTIYFVVFKSMGIEGILSARLYGSILIAVILTIFVVLPRSKTVINIQYITSAIKFGLPMIISSLGSMVFLLSDRYMLSILSTKAEVGKYGFGLKIANFINLIFVQTIGLSYMPSVLDSDKTINIRYYRKMLTYYCFIIGFIILGFLFFYREILSLIVKNKEYWQGLDVVPFLCLSFMIMGMNYFVGLGLFLTKKTRLYLIPAFVAASFNIIINIKLIPVLGMFGASCSLVLAQIIYTSILTYLSGKEFKIGFEWGKITLIFIICFALFYINIYINFKPLILTILLKLILISLLPILLYFFSFFEQIEIDRLKQSLMNAYYFLFKKTK